MTKKIIIVGCPGHNRITSAIEALKQTYPEIQVVETGDVENLEMRSLSEHKITAPPLLIHDKVNFKAPKTRAERRKEDREKKNN